MASNVNITTSNPRTGTNVTVTRRLLDYDITYVDDNGVPQHASGTVTWPDVLLNASLPAGWTREQQEAVALAAGRLILGIDHVV